MFTVCNLPPTDCREEWETVDQWTPTFKVVIVDVVRRWKMDYLTPSMTPRSPIDLPSIENENILPLYVGSIKSLLIRDLRSGINQDSD